VSEGREEYGQGYHHLGRIVCIKSGQPLSYHNLRDVWVRLLKKHGSREIRFLDLRHTCASLLLSLDVHPKVVQSLLRHSSFKITMDLYSYLMPGMKSEAASAIESLLT
jgi:integrase